MTFPQILPYISITIAILGAVLGALGFYNQYLHKFSPRANFFGTLLVKRVEARNIVWTTEVIASISLSNSQNAYGEIEDFILCIYSHAGISSNPKYFYAEKIYEKDNQIFFAPIVLQPKSIEKVKIGFRPDLSTGPGEFLVASEDVATILYAKFANKVAYVKVAESYLYDKRLEKSNTSSIDLELSLVNLDALRRRGLRNIGVPRTSSFDGLCARAIFYFLQRMKGYALLPLQFAKTIVVAILHSVRLIVRSLLVDPIAMLLIKSEARKHQKIQFRFVQPDRYSAATFTKMENILRKRVLAINRVLAEDDCINLRSESGKIELSRNRIKVDIHLLGANGIVASGGGYGSPKSINLEFLYKHMRLGYRYWTFRGNYIPEKSIAVVILDYFCMYSRPE